MKKSLIAAALLATSLTAFAANDVIVTGGVGHDSSINHFTQQVSIENRGDVNVFGANLGKVSLGLEATHAADHYRQVGLFVKKACDLTPKTEIGLKAGINRISPNQGESGYVLHYGLTAGYKLTDSVTVGAELRKQRNDLDADRFEGTVKSLTASYKF